MIKRILRSFFYLDENIVDDYLSQIDGGLIEGPYTSKETTSGNKEANIGGKAAIVNLGVKGGSSSSSETTQTIRNTPAAKFARLYDLLNDGTIQVLNGFDEAVYETIELGEIVEVRGIAELPQWEKISKAITDFSALADLVTAFGVNPLEDPETYQAIQGMTTLVSSTNQKETILIISPIGSPEFKFITKIDVSRLSRKKEELETEVTVLGKVTKRLSKGEKIDIFRLLPQNLEQLNTFTNAQKLNREQRRSNTKKSKARNNISTNSPLDEAVEYPAIQILPIAIYQ